MKNADMHTVEFLSAAKYNLIDQYSLGDYEPPTDKSLGGTNDLKVLDYSVDASGVPTIKYIRAYNTGDKYDAIAKPNTSTTMNVAWNSGTLNDHHKNFKVFSVTFDSSKMVVQPIVQPTSNDTLSTETPSTSTLVIVPTSSTAAVVGNSTTAVTPSTTPVINNNTITSETPQSVEEEEDEEFDFWEFHGIILTILWTIFNFVGYVYARFLRHHPIWIWIHFICSGLTSFISVAVMAASIAKGKLRIFYFLFFHKYL
jgi:hypothetical protein